MKTLVICTLLMAIAACGSSDSASPKSGTSGGSGEVPKQVAVSEESCAVLENGVLTDLFGAEPAQVTYRRSIPVKRAGHVLCMAVWDRPDKVALESAHLESVQAWARNSATGKKEAMPKPPRLIDEASITLMATSFDSAQAAVASLEAAVATLQKGVSTKIAGKEYESQVDFGDWIDGVGDKAIFSEKGELLVADNGRRFAVNVKVSDDPAADRKQALALARRVMDLP